MLLLGIESSCDETAAAVVEDGRRILSNVVASQFDLHRPFGGVVPEVASRAHCERISAVIDEALRLLSPREGEGLGVRGRDEIDAIAVVNRPGLVGALLVGIAAAKALALAWDKPLIGIDHILGHVYASTLSGFERFPHISLIVSGGHTCLYRVNSPLKVAALGQTADDAAGEAFDKVAKMLDLPFPGGPALAALSDQAPPSARGLFHDICLAQQADKTLNFSFSGLKTAVYYHLRGTTRGRGPLRTLSADERAAVAASFQEAACEIIVAKTLAACGRESIQAATIGGGVACNMRLRKMFQERSEAESIEIFFPPPALCTDNAAMCAGLAYHKLLAGKVDTLDLDADPTPKRKVLSIEC